MERYGDLPRSVTARYLLADSCRRAAEAIGDGLSRRRRRRAARGVGRAARKLFEQALLQQRRVVAELGSGDESRLTNVDKATLRNSRFAIGEVCFALQRYEEAANAYAAAANAVAGRAESLDALLRLAEACRTHGPERRSPRRPATGQNRLDPHEQGNPLRRNNQVRTASNGMNS